MEKTYQVRDEDWLYVVLKDTDEEYKVYPTVILSRFQPKYNKGIKGIFIEKKDAEDYMKFLNSTKRESII